MHKKNKINTPYYCFQKSFTLRLALAFVNSRISNLPRNIFCILLSALSHYENGNI